MDSVDKLKSSFARLGVRLKIMLLLKSLLIVIKNLLLSSSSIRNVRSSDIAFKKDVPNNV
jgi:hypothetical protein